MAIERRDDVTENALQADANRSETNRLVPSSESLDINETIISADGASLKGNERPTYSNTSIDNDVIPELHQLSPSHDTIDEPIPLNDASPGEERAKKTSSNDGSFLCEVLEAVALRIASKEDPSVDEGELKNGSCEGASSKSVNSSKKCLQTVSGLTADSGYTETSVNSSKSQCGEGASNFKCTQSSRILNIDKLQAATCILDFDLPCFCVTELISDAGNFSSPDQQVQAMTASQTESDTSEDVDSGFTETSEGTTIDENSDTSDSDPVDETETTCKEEMYSTNPLFQRVYTNGIALEEMKRAQDGRAVVGTVLVRNDRYEKEVGIRHSSNTWKTFEDTRAQWVETVEGGAFDRFEFSVDLPEESFYMELAFHYYQMWDNNNGQNYSVSCTIF